MNFDRHNWLMPTLIFLTVWTFPTVAILVSSEESPSSASQRLPHVHLEQVLPETQQDLQVAPQRPVLNLSKVQLASISQPNYSMQASTPQFFLEQE